MGDMRKVARNICLKSIFVLNEMSSIYCIRTVTITKLTSVTKYANFRY